MRTAGAPAISPAHTNHTGFERYAWGALAYNVLVVLWGALVRATGSGAGCGGHWPLCNGEVVPQAPAIGTIIEYTHRLMSGTALVAVVALFLRARRVFPREHAARRFAGWSLVFLVIEALLGAGLVLFNYVAHNVSVGRAFYLSIHLANTQVLLAMLTLTALTVKTGLMPRWREAPKVLLTALPLTVFLSMTGAVAALGDTLFPASSLSSAVQQEFSGASHILMRLRVMHPALAVATALFLLYTASTVVRLRPAPRVKRLAAMVAAMVILQMIAGAVNIALLAPVWMQLVHLLLADVLWVGLVAMSVALMAGGQGSVVSDQKRL